MRRAQRRWDAVVEGWRGRLPHPASLSVRRRQLLGRERGRASRFPVARCGGDLPARAVVELDAHASVQCGCRGGRQRAERAVRINRDGGRRGNGGHLCVAPPQQQPSVDVAAELQHPAAHTQRGAGPVGQRARKGVAVAAGGERSGRVGAAQPRVRGAGGGRPAGARRHFAHHASAQGEERDKREERAVSPSPSRLSSSLFTVPNPNPPRHPQVKEVRGCWMEQWHQKLHNNTTPDDVPICEAYLLFLEDGVRANGPGSLDVFWTALAEEVFQKLVWRRSTAR